MGSLPELRHIQNAETSQHTAPRRSFGAATGLQVRPTKGVAHLRTTAPKVAGQPLTPALLEIQGGRRRESCTSSLGAASVHRLVRGGGGFGCAGGGVQAPRGHWPMTNVWTRRAMAAIFARLFSAAALLVLQALQGSFGPWSLGPLLMSLLHGAATMAAFLAPAITRVLRPHRALTMTYLLFAGFSALHVYPKTYILLPAYLAAGICWTTMSMAHETILGELAVSEGYPDTQNAPAHQAPGGGSQIRARTLLRRLTRASRFSKDCGLLMAAVVLSFLPPIINNVTTHDTIAFNYTACYPPHCSEKIDNEKLHLKIGGSSSGTEIPRSNITMTEDPNWPQIDNAEDLEEWREKSCGYRGCPGDYSPPQSMDGVQKMGGLKFIPYALCTWCLIAAVISLWGWCWFGESATVTTPTGRVQWQMVLMSMRDNKMKFVAPLAFFIGLEQGFFYAHFLQWYVVCVFGDGVVWHVLGGAAFLRALVAATLSMLLAHGRRRLVAGVGLVWHACLLLALGAWRAADTDRNLPPGIAAAWAGCGAVWDLLLPTLIDERIPGGRTALALALRSFGLSVAMCARALLCARWALRALFLALPAATVPLLFIPQAPHR